MHTQRVTRKHKQLSAIETAAAIECREALHFLARDVYACELPQGAVFLDLRSLKYFALEKNFLPVFPEVVRNWRSHCPVSKSPAFGTPSPSDLSQLLQSKGFLSHERQISPYFTDLPRAVSACSPNWSLRTSYLSHLAMLMRVSRAYTTAKAALDSQTLCSLLARLARSKATPTYRHSRAIQDPTYLLTAFAKARAWLYTARDRCLIDSLVLTYVLRKYNVAAHFCIGVDLQPFSAHAWVQLGSLVIDDSVEHVLKFTPLVCV